MLVERFIKGRYEKFNSNSGWSSKEAATPDAFSHWTWVASNGQYLICDLQGRRNDSNYLLTDPAILSGTYEFGITDLGPSGIRNWFARHECNAYCHSLGITWNRPKKKTTNNGKAIRKVKKTTYRL